VRFCLFFPFFFRRKRTVDDVRTFFFFAPLMRVLRDDLTGRARGIVGFSFPPSLAYRPLADERSMSLLSFFPAALPPRQIGEDEHARTIAIHYTLSLLFLSLRSQPSPRRRWAVPPPLFFPGLSRVASK